MCQEAVAALGWRVLQRGEAFLVCKEVTHEVMRWWTFPAKVEILLTGESSDATRVILKGSNFGFGPIQSGHLQGQVGNLRNRIELVAQEVLRNIYEQKLRQWESQGFDVSELKDRLFKKG